MRKICVITGTRAEFGLLQWLMKEIQDDADLKLGIVATGMHLSPEFGLTYKNIEDQGFKIDKKVEILLSSDSPVGISKSMGLGLISFSEVFQELKPDIIVVLGDRFEIFSAVSAAMICRIPVAHLHGGEATEGLIDEPIRHSITKMSHLHFTATDVYRDRVIQLGEKPSRVFNTGTPGLDSIEKLNLLDRKEFEEQIGFRLGEQNIIITFHPVTLELGTAATQFNQLLKALDNYNANLIFTKPNADTDGRVIVEMIDDYVASNRKKACAFTSMGQFLYLSALKNVDLVLGNSSSGLVEAPSFKIPTINIGDRQRGRLKSKSVIDCEPTEDSITQAIEKSFDIGFRKGLTNLKNPYGEGGASKKIKKILKNADLKDIIKKKFHDL